MFQREKDHSFQTINSIEKPRDSTSPNTTIKQTVHLGTKRTRNGKNFGDKNKIGKKIAHNAWPQRNCSVRRLMQDLTAYQTAI